VASLIKNSTRCKDVMLTMVRCHALSHLVVMTSAEHLVMQNEAVVALTILVTVLRGRYMQSWGCIRQMAAMFLA